MTDFATLQSDLADELHEPSDSSVIARQIVSALNYYRPKAFIFSDAETSFDTVIGQDTYVRGVEIPGDLMAVDNLYVVNGTQRSRLIKETTKTIRLLKASNSVTSGFPSMWSWYNNALVFWPIPGQVYAIELDYRRDATRDEDTGLVIDKNATTETNEFFRTGEELLRTRAAYTYAMVRSHDESMIGRFKALNMETERSLMLERDLLKFNSKTSRFF